MSTYKVIQDIEAEDKLLGPLTLRQFIFAMVAVMFYYFCFLLVTKHAALLLFLFLPPALFSTFFAIPFGGDQPTEIWALAKIRFLFKPRRRIWDQSGAKDLVTINAPKKVEEVRTSGMSQREVRSRLSALADTIDSRGWAVKNVNLNLSIQAPDALTQDLNSDRLIDVNGLPQEVPTTDIEASDDILDEENNPIAHQFEQMIAASTQEHRKQIMTMMSHRDSRQSPVASQPDSAAVPATNDQRPATDNNWFLSQPVQSSLGQVTGGITAAEPTADEELLAKRLKARNSAPGLATAHLRTIQPLGMPDPATTGIQDDTATDDTQVPATTPLPAAATPKPINLELAQNNDLNVATLAREAGKTNAGLSGEADDEVVIALR